MEPPVRIELTTFRLQGGCSTTELGRLLVPAYYVSEIDVEEIERTSEILPCDPTNIVPAEDKQPIRVGRFRPQFF